MSSNAKNDISSNNEALIRTAANGDLAEVVRLIPISDPLASGGAGWTALMWAAHSGYTEIAALLLPVSDSLAKDKYGSTALMKATFCGHTDCVDKLASASNIDEINAKGQTALDISKRRQHKGCSEILKAHALAKSEHAELSKDVPQAFTPRPSVNTKPVRSRSL